MKLKKLIEELNLFERERTPAEIRLFGIAYDSRKILNTIVDKGM